MNTLTKEVIENIELNHLGNIILFSFDRNKGSEPSKKFSDSEIIGSLIEKDLKKATTLAEDMMKDERVYQKFKWIFPVREKEFIIEKLISL